MVYWIGVKCMMPPSQALLKCKVLVERTNRAAIVLSTDSKHLPRYAKKSSLKFSVLLASEDAGHWGPRLRTLHRDADSEDH